MSSSEVSQENGLVKGRGRARAASYSESYNLRIIEMSSPSGIFLLRSNLRQQYPLAYPIRLPCELVNSS